MNEDSKVANKPLRSSGREFDVILWGVTGYTGRFAAQYLAQRSKSRAVKWALAGRNMASMQKVADEISKICSQNGPVALLEADAEREETLKNVASRAKVIVSYVGPYAVWGESMMKACLATKTDYIDITAELPWVEEMISKYDKTAKELRVKLICCCGFDFVPNDLMLVQAVDELSRLGWKPSETPLKVIHGSAQSTTRISGGTALSGMHLCSRLPLRSAVDYYTSPYALCRQTEKLASSHVKKQNVYNLTPEWMPAVNKYCSPFVMTSLMNKFVHWSNALNDYKWGHNLIYMGGETHANQFVAWYMALLIWLQFLFALTLARLPFLWQYLPLPGSGPAVTPDSAFMIADLLAMPATSADGKSFGKYVHVRWSLLKAEAYIFAARASIEGALALVLDEDSVPDRYGILTCSAGIGSSVIKRLSEHASVQMKVTVVDNVEVPLNHKSQD